MISSIGSSTSYAAGLVRSCYISGLGYMDLPNIYELMVIWCEADNIDNMDPTAEDYPDLKLGYTATNGRFDNQKRWSSTIQSDNANAVYYVSKNGYVGSQGSGSWYYDMVIPVLEL